MALQLKYKTEDFMKTIIIILILSSAFTMAQNANDSTGNCGSMQEREQLQIQRHKMTSTQEQIGPKGNPDVDGNVDHKKKDVFIDKDGDGICDTRQNGMSFNKMRRRLGSGQKGPGKDQHGNGNDNKNGNGRGNGK